MTIHRQFIDQIIKKRDATLSELVGKDGLGIRTKATDVEELIDPLDQIFYTIDFLQKKD